MPPFSAIRAVYSTVFAVCTAALLLMFFAHGTRSPSPSERVLPPSYFCAITAQSFFYFCMWLQLRTTSSHSPLTQICRRTVEPIRERGNLKDGPFLKQGIWWLEGKEYCMIRASFGLWYQKQEWWNWKENGRTTVENNSLVWNKNWKRLYSKDDCRKWNSNSRGRRQLTVVLIFL